MIERKYMLKYTQDNFALRQCAKTDSKQLTQLSVLAAVKTQYGIK